MQNGQWKVGELAKQTGLSIRTLHYYDQIGLLTPSHRTHSGHRVYGGRDIVRLQQIASLRQLGFSLEEISDCLRNPNVTPRRVIQFHIRRLKEQIKAQTNLCRRLERVERSLAAAKEVSVKELIQTIEVTNMIDKYYTPEQLEQLKQRADSLGEERIRQSEKDWAQLIDEVRDEMKKGTDPSSERVRGLAQRWFALIQEFTGGDPGIQKSLGSMWEKEQNIHGFDTTEMRQMFAYISKAKNS